MKRDFRAPKNMGIFDAKIAKKKYPQSKASKNHARQGFLMGKKVKNRARESSLHGAVSPIRRGGQ